ncbi:MAG TPA: hypothetical protein VMD29_11645, partial [Terracidiphilus sp.]|nr:hypothetical protein [Terracidiphilus sp.]
MRTLSRSSATLIAILAAAAFGLPAQAPTSPATPPAAPAAQPQPAAAPAPAAAVPGQAHPLTPDDLQAFFDGIFPLQLERGDIAG